MVIVPSSPSKSAKTFTSYPIKAATLPILRFLPYIDINTRRACSIKMVEARHRAAERYRLEDNEENEENEDEGNRHAVVQPFTRLRASKLLNNWSVGNLWPNYRLLKILLSLILVTICILAIITFVLIIWHNICSLLTIIYHIPNTLALKISAFFTKIADDAPPWIEERNLIRNVTRLIEISPSVQIWQDNAVKFKKLVPVFCTLLPQLNIGHNCDQVEELSMKIKEGLIIAEEKGKHLLSQGRRGFTEICADMQTYWRRDDLSVQTALNYHLSWVRTELQNYEVLLGDIISHLTHLDIASKAILTNICLAFDPEAAMYPDQKRLIQIILDALWPWSDIPGNKTAEDMLLKIIGMKKPIGMYHSYLFRLREQIKIMRQIMTNELIRNSLDKRLRYYTYIMNNRPIEQKKEKMFNFDFEED